MVGNNMQAIFGTRSENLKTDIEAYLRATGADLAASPAPGVAAAPAPRPSSVPDADVLRAGASIADALGGARNIVSAEACALTRCACRSAIRRWSMRMRCVVPASPE